MKSDVWYKVLWEQGGFGECRGGRYLTNGGSPGGAGKGTLQAEGAVHAEAVSGTALGRVGSRGSGRGAGSRTAGDGAKGKVGLGARALDCHAGRLTKENFAMG